MKKNIFAENWLANRIENSKSHQQKIWSEGINDLTIQYRGKNREVLSCDDKHYIDFMSCSYLGLETDKRLQMCVLEKIKTFGVQYAAARTRAKCDFFDELENKLNMIFMNSYSVIFNSVGAGHLAILPILGSGKLPGYILKEDGVGWVLDKTAHASIQMLRGILEQFGKVYRLDFTEEEKLKSVAENICFQNKTPVFLSDSLGSMGGAVDLKYIKRLADEYQGYLYVDDAHGTSIVGKNGCGYTLNIFKEFPENLILLSSLSKAFGSHGGSVSFYNEDSSMFIKKYSQNYIFGGPPSLPGIAGCLASANIHLSTEISVLQERLWKNVFLFDEILGNVLDIKEKHSPIRTILIGDEDKAICVSKTIREKGFLVTAAMYPTVAYKKSIIRVAFSASHIKKQIELLAKTIQEIT